MKDGNFGLRESVSLATIIIVAKFLYTSTSVVTQAVGTAGWYMTLISCGTAMVFFLLTCVLMERFPGKNIIEVFEKVFGKLIGKIFGISYAAYVVYYVGSILREFVEMIKAYNLPYTPPSIIIILFLGVCILGAYLGLEVIARTSYVCAIVVISGLIILLLLGIPNYNMGYLRPYFGYGIGKTLLIGFLRSSAYEEVLLLALFINSINGVKNLKKAGMISLVISGLLASALLFCHILTFQYTQGGENLSGIFQLSRVIYFNRFFQRVESIFLFTWVITSIIAVTLSLYIAVSIYCTVFRIKCHRPLLLPIAFLVFMVAMLPANLSEVIQINMLILRQYSFILVFGAPVLALTVSLLLGKKGVRGNAQKS